MGRNLVHFLDRFMVFLAPTTPVQWAVRTVFFLSAVVATTYLFEVVLLQVDDTSFLDELVTVPIVALPFVLLVLAAATRQTRLVRELTVLASTDPLTSLPNRLAFLERLEHLSAAGPTLMIIADADHFKRVNDQFGHGAGDEALIAIAHRLRALAGRDGVAARLGGEEFALCLPKPSRQRSLAICSALASGVSIPQRPAPVTLSLGVTVMRDGTTPQSVLKRADDALYVAKRRGRACAIWWPDIAFTRAEQMGCSCAA